MKKKLFTIFVILIIVTFNTISTYGFNLNSITGSTTPINSEAIKIRDRVLAVAESIGITVVACMLVFLAMKYFTSAPNDRADLKKYAIIFTIGATFILGAIGVVELFKIFADEITGAIEEKPIISNEEDTDNENISEDETKPQVKSIEITNPTSGEYEPGEKIKIRISFDENIKGTASTLKLKVGNEIGKGAMEVSDPTGNTNYIDYVYTTDAEQFGEIEIYSYTGGNITDAAGNNANLTKKQNTGNKIIIKDTTAPTLKNMQIITPVTGEYNPGEKITIRAEFSENIKGIAPTLQLKVGDAIGTGTMTTSNPIGNTKCIDYVYTTDAEQFGKIEIHSYTGGNITDAANNKANLQKKKIREMKLRLQFLKKIWEDLLLKLLQHLVLEQSIIGNIFQN